MTQFEQQMAKLEALMAKLKALEEIAVKIHDFLDSGALQMQPVAAMESEQEGSRKSLTGRPELPQGAIPPAVMDKADPRYGADCPTVVDWCRGNWLREDFETFYPDQPWVRPPTKEELNLLDQNTPDPDVDAELAAELEVERAKPPTRNMQERAAKEPLGDPEEPPQAEDIAAQVERENEAAEEAEEAQAAAEAGV